MSLQDKVDKINQLNCEMWPENSVLSMDAIRRLVAQTVEELGETHSAARSYFGREYSPEKNATVDHVSEEVGDTLSTVMVIGHLFGRSIDDSLDRVIAKLEKRKAKRDEETQIVEPTPGVKVTVRKGEITNVTVTSLAGVHCEYCEGQPLKYLNDHQPLKYDVDDPINQKGSGVFNEGPYDRPA